MLKTLFTIIKLQFCYSANIINYYLINIPIFSKLFGYSSNSKKVISDTKFYLYILKFISPVIFIYIINIILTENILKNNVISPNEFSIFFTSCYISLFTFLAFVNSYIFNLSVPKTYAIKFLKIEQKVYLKYFFIYSIIKCFIVHFVSIYMCSNYYLLSWYHVLILPLFTTTMKIISTVIELILYTRTRKILSYSKFYKIFLLISGIIFSYILISCNYLITITSLIIVLPLIFLIAYTGLQYILNFDFSTINKKLFDTEYNYNIKLSGSISDNIDSFTSTNIIKDKNYSQTQIDNNIKNAKSPFKYINNLFFKRFKHLLFPVLSVICFIFLQTILLAFLYGFITKHVQFTLHSIIISSIPLIPLVLYICNITKKITNSLFYNCDASLLYYKFYKNQQTIFFIFVERFKKCMIYNSIPSILFLIFMFVLSYFSNITNLKFYIYVTGIVFLLTTIFTTLHLFIYYIIQPYDYVSKKQHPLYFIFNIAIIIIGIFFTGYTITAEKLFCYLLLIALCFVPLTFILIYKFGYKTLKHRSI